CQANHVSIMVKERHLMGQAPYRFLIGIEMQFELIVNCLTVRNHMLILGGITGTEPGRKHVKRRAPDQLALLLATTTLHQRAIDNGITTTSILHKEHNIGKLIKERLCKKRIGQYQRHL